MTDWQSWHLHVDSLAPRAVEAAVLDVVGPTVAEFGRNADRPRPWFFIRYWQGGPHVRLRLADAGPDAAAVQEALARRTAAVNAALPAGSRLTTEDYRRSAAPIADRGEAGIPLPLTPLLPPGSHPARYEPEFDRYGGSALIGVSEALFHASSVVCLRACQARAGGSRTAADGLEAMAATLSAWPGDRLALLRGARDGWARWLGAEFDDAAEQARTLAHLVPALRELTDGATSRWTPWTARLGAAAQEWIDRLGPARARQVFGSHLHMTQNRLGVGATREGRLAAILLILLDGAP
ncbi:thiopeptide-type bacteriocin biosynthesis protein [Micromonospora sp. R77]|uniref:thiopeptide-type bacteriocin biosynthesis protein n=1 Tax=Micromonospora sp. R77 TaxID=2925836 RepID=UPI001F60FCD9|nr:thiopeptide-type bacteriocin biosynthesis protein [Micromonospora sp. R77]MCI4061357.1 thiopeptide-type bacteriocin biosynthesis protein [Micromonospora sp. R77]